MCHKSGPLVVDSIHYATPVDERKRGRKREGKVHMLPMLSLAQKTVDDSRYRVAATRLCAHPKDTCRTRDAAMERERKRENISVICMQNVKKENLL